MPPVKTNCTAEFALAFANASFMSPELSALALAENRLADALADAYSDVQLEKPGVLTEVKTPVGGSSMQAADVDKSAALIPNAKPNSKLTNAVDRTETRADIMPTLDHKP